MMLAKAYRHWRTTTLRGLGSDMTFARFKCALGSFLCVLVLLYPDDTMARKGAGLLKVIFQTDPILALFFLADWAGLMWRIYDPVERPRWALASAIFGFLLWMLLVISVYLGFGFYTLQSAIVTSSLIGRFWLIVRTGNGPSVVGS